MRRVTGCHWWAVLLFVLPWLAGCDLLAGDEQCAAPALAINWAQEVIDLVNDERGSRGLASLTEDQTLVQIAEEYACEMILGGFFDHVSPVTGSTVATRAVEHGYAYLIVGENLAAGQQSPAEVVAAWMASDGHRANILAEGYIQIGVAVRTGGEYGIYWVQEFGLPQP